MNTFIVLIVIFFSSTTFALDKNSYFCAGDVEQYAPVKEYIAVRASVNTITGVTNSLEAFATFTNIVDCENAIEQGTIKKQDNSVKLRVSEKCYATSRDANLYYLLDEKRNVDTGIVSSLSVKNEFDNLKSCILNL